MGDINLVKRGRFESNAIACCRAREAGALEDAGIRRRCGAPWWVHKTRRFRHGVMCREEGIES